LQDALGLQNFGRNPDELSNIVMPTFSIGQLYQADRLAVRRQNETWSTSNPSLKTCELQIPVGQIWFIEKLFFNVTDLPANSDYEFRSYIEPNQNQGPLPGNRDAFLLDHWELSTGAVGTFNTAYKITDVKAWFPSGYSFNLQEVTNTATFNTLAAVGALAVVLDA
jgi:hypothetical protein